jgi:hypothetical protein
MADIIQIRGGTAAAWTAANPILANKELGVETDTNFMKIGNGVTAWNSKAYISFGIAEAPSDGKFYNRRNAAWVEHPGDGIGFNSYLADVTLVTGFLTIANSHIVKFPTGGVFADTTSEYTLAASSGTLTLTDDSLNILCAYYNGGTPIWQVVTDMDLIDMQTRIPYCRMFKRTGSTFMHTQGFCELNTNVADRIVNRLVRTNEYAHEAGLTLSASAGNYFISAGEVWVGINEINLVAIDANTNDGFFDCMYAPTSLGTFNAGTTYAKGARVTQSAVDYISLQDGNVGNTPPNSTYWSTSISSTWGVPKAASGADPLLDNAHYMDPIGTGLVPLTAGYWNINWIYRGVEAETHTYRVLDTAQYQSSALAQTASPPNSLPALITSHAILVGRVIVQQGQTTGYVIEDSLTTKFSSGANVTNHNILGGIQGGTTNQYYHLTSAQNTLVAGMTGLDRGGFAFPYSYDFSLTTTPASGKISFNTNTITAVTTMYMNETNTDGILWDALIDTLQQDNWIYIYSRVNPAKYAAFKLSAAFTSGAGVDTIPVVYQFGAGGNFTDAEALGLAVELLSPPSAINPATETLGVAAVVGTSIKYSREDHIHPLTTPGATTQILYNNAGVGAGDANHIWDSANKRVTITGGSLAQTAIANPTAVASTLLQYVGDFGGRLMPKFMGPSGMDWPVQPHFGFQRIVTLTATGSAAAVYGAAAYALTGGTIAYVAPTTGSVANQCAKISLPTGTTAGTVAYYRPPAGDAQCYLGNAAGSGGFTFMARFGMSALTTGNRIFIGLGPRVTSTNVDPNTILNQVGLSVIASTGNWAITMNNGSGTATVTTLSSPAIALNATDLIELVMFAAPNSSTITYRVTNWSTGLQATGTLTTKVPAVNTVLVPHAWLTNNAQAAACTMWINRMYLETDY